MAGGRIKGITIEIDGSTTGLDKALKGTDANLSSVQRSLKDVNRLLKIDPTNTELLLQKQKLLSQAIDETKQKLEMEKEALRQAAEQDMPADKMDALKREVIATTQELKSLEKQAKDSGSILGTTLQETGKKIQETGEKISNVGEGISDVGKELSTRVTAPLVGLGTVTVKTAADFEAAMSDVAATMGTTKDNITDLSEKAREMGEQTSFSATEAAQGLNILAMSGLDATEQISTIEPVLNLASAGSLSLESAASYATGAIKGFGDSCENAQYYTDLMAKGATLANTDVSGLGEALSGSAATAKSYGQQADSVTLSLLRLAEQNVTGSAATTALNRAMADLYTPTDAAKTALDELGVSAYNVDGSARDINTVIDELGAALSGMSDEEANAYKNTIFTSQGLSAFNKMTSTSTDKVEEFREGLASASDGMGSAKEQAQTKLDNLQGQLTILQSAMSEAAISVGEILMPAVKEIAEKIQEWTDKFNSLDEKQKEIIVIIAAVAAAIGPVLVIIGTLISSIGQIITGTGSFISFLGRIPAAALPVIGIMAAVVLAGVLLYQNWDVIKEKAAELWNSLTEKFTLIHDTVTEKVEAMKSAVSEKVEFLKSSVTEKIESMKSNVSEKVESLKSGVTEKMETMKSNVSEKVESLKSGVSEKVGAMKSAVTEKVESMKQTTVNKFNEMKTSMGDKMQEARDSVSQKLQSMKAAYDSHGGGIQGTVAAMMEGVKAYYSSGYSFLNTLTGGKLGEMASLFGDKLGQASNVAKEKFESIRSGISDKINAAKEVVLSVIEKIKDAFNFSWSLPHLNLPHISVDGGEAPYGIGGKGSLPSFSIEWYSKAMDNAYLLNGASIFGKMNGKFLGGGESGSEMILGKQYMIDMIQQASAQSNIELIRAMNNIGDQMLGIMYDYFPEFAKQKVVIPERTLGRTLREMGVAIK